MVNVCSTERIQIQQNVKYDQTDRENYYYLDRSIPFLVVIVGT